MMIFVKPSIDPCSPCSHQATAAAKWLCCLVAVWFYQHGWHQQRSHHRPVHQTTPWLAPQCWARWIRWERALTAQRKLFWAFDILNRNKSYENWNAWLMTLHLPKGPLDLYLVDLYQDKVGQCKYCVWFSILLRVLLKPLTESQVVPSITRNGWYVPSEGLAGGFTVLYCFWCKHQI